MKRYVWFLVAAAALALLLSVAGRMGLLGGGSPETATRSTDRVDIGGPFELVDRSGATVTNDSYAGRHRLVYFGFVNCPDICPTTLQVMTLALDELGPAAESVVPMFVTLDPRRDDSAAVDAYLDHFHPRFVGLTGTPEQVAAMARTYRVYHAEVPLPDSAAEYTVDHSSFLYLMDPDGHYLTHFSHDETPEAIAATLREAVSG